MSHGPLAGRRIVVTRPRGQAAGLIDAITAAGGTPLCFPLLEITPMPDAPDVQAAIERLPGCVLAIFISPNAAECSVPGVLRRWGGWPPQVRAATVGPGTVKCLGALGVAEVLCPGERFDSEGLLALPELTAERMAGQQVVIFRGDGGRELLADTLRARGAQVDCPSCYRRSGPVDGMAGLERWWAEGLDALTLSSSEALRYLVDGLAPDWRARLAQTPVFVPHPRIAEGARQLGLQQVIETAPADAGIIAGLCAYNWQN